MSKETMAQIVLRLAARKLRVKLEPLPVNSTPTALDVEDGFLEDRGGETKPAEKRPLVPTFESDPE